MLEKLRAQGKWWTNQLAASLLVLQISSSPVSHFPAVQPRQRFNKPWDLWIPHIQNKGGGVRVTTQSGANQEAAEPSFPKFVC